MWCLQPAAAEKLRREVARVSGEVERLDKEVQRQKALRWGRNPAALHPLSPSSSCAWRYLLLGATAACDL